MQQCPKCSHRFTAPAAAHDGPSPTTFIGLLDSMRLAPDGISDHVQRVLIRIVVYSALLALAWQYIFRPVFYY